MKQYFWVLALMLVGDFISAQSTQDLLRYAQRGSAVGIVSSGLNGAGTAGSGNTGAFLSNPAGLGWINKHSQTSGFRLLEGGLNVAKSKGTNLFTVQTDADNNTSLSSTISKTGISNFTYLSSPQTAQGTLVYGFAFNSLGNYMRKLNFEGNNRMTSFTDYLLPGNGEYQIGLGTDGIVNTADDNFSFTNPLTSVAFDHVYALLFNTNAFNSGQNPFRAGMQNLPAQQSGSVVERGGSSELSAALAWEAAPNLMVGFSANMPLASYENARYLRETDNLNLNNTYPYNLSSLEVSENLQGSIVGVNLRLGISSQVIEDKLKFGINIESPTRYSINENYSGQMKTIFDDNEVQTYGDGSNENLLNGEFTYKFKSPWRFSAGVEAKLKAVRLLGDVEYVDWSQASASSSDNPTYYNALTEQFSNQYESVLNVRVGAEANMGNLTLRGGVGLQPDPRTETIVSDGNTQLETARDKSSASLGLSYQINPKFQLDIAVVGEGYKDVYLPYSDNYTPYPAYYENDPVVKRDIQDVKVLAGFGIKF